MKEQAQEKDYHFITANLIMIGKHTPHQHERSAGIVTINVKHIEKMLEKYDWQGYDMSMFEQVVAEHS